MDECQVTLIEGEGIDEISRSTGLAINSRGLGSEFTRRFLTEMDLVISRDSRQIVDWLRHRTTRSPACLTADSAAHRWPSPNARRDPRRPDGPASPAPGPAVQAARSFRPRHRFAEPGVDRLKLFEEFDIGELGSDITIITIFVFAIRYQDWPSCRNNDFLFSPIDSLAITVRYNSLTLLGSRLAKIVCNSKTWPRSHSH